MMLSMCKQMKHETREAWLTHAVSLLIPMLQEHNPGDCPPVRISCGWPKGGRGRTIGQCWSNEASKDKHFEMFISPKLDESIDVLETVLHELIHAWVGVDAGHKGPFRVLAKAVGFMPPMTSTPASEELKEALALLCGDLGPYPHASLQAMTTTKQSTRMRKITCQCGFLCRATKTQIETVGVPTCACGLTMTAEDQ